ncbi:hypothetical protein BLGI_4324 [Brevibacillus laterosporus GI-9]|nr:hypothetical protein BLGI_4324 [Brevibacillus laterosporus GI-9]
MKSCGTAYNMETIKPPIIGGFFFFSTILPLLKKISFFSGNILAVTPL